MSLRNWFNFFQLIPETWRFGRLRLQVGDILVLKFTEEPTDKERKRAQDFLQQVTRGRGVRGVVLGPKATFQVITQGGGGDGS